MSKYLNLDIVRELLRVKADGNLFHRESQTLEFKESFNFAGLADYFRDFSAFANNKGGYLIFGVKDRPKREAVGLSEKASNQFDRLDPETISGSILECFSCNIVWEHEIYEIDGLKFGAFYIHECLNKPVIAKKDEGKDQVLKNGDIYFRYGGRTQRIQYAELENIINKRIESTNNSWLDLFEKIGKAGPQNAAVLNLDDGSIEKGDKKVLVVDEDLVRQMNFIREGEFSEVEGEKVLKLIGEVTTVSTLEIVQKVKENLLKDYPFSATDLQREIKKRVPDAKMPLVYQVIKDHDIRGNRDYAAYNFRSKKHEDQYYKDKVVPTGTPCIFNQKAIDFLSQVLVNELNKVNPA